MRRFQTAVFVSCLLCVQQSALSQNNPVTTISVQQQKEFEEIEALIRDVYVWREDSLPYEIDMIADENDSLYLGFDVVHLQFVVEKLKSTAFFTEGFIANYEKIYLTINQQMKDHTIEYFVGDLPPVNDGADPWCNCQDVPFDDPNPWTLIHVKPVDFQEDRGVFLWEWGGIDLDETSGWKGFLYLFNVVKENGEWKIDYLEGLDFEMQTRVREN